MTYQLMPPAPRGNINKATPPPVIYLGGSPDFGDVLHIPYGGIGGAVKALPIVAVERRTVTVKTAWHRRWIIDKWNLVKHLRCGEWRWEVMAEPDTSLLSDHELREAAKAHLTAERVLAIRDAALHGDGDPVDFPPCRDPVPPEYELPV